MYVVATFAALFLVAVTVLLLVSVNAILASSELG